VACFQCVTVTSKVRWAPSVTDRRVSVCASWGSVATNVTDVTGEPPACCPTVSRVETALTTGTGSFATWEVGGFSCLVLVRLDVMVVSVTAEPPACCLTVSRVETALTTGIESYATWKVGLLMVYFPLLLAHILCTWDWLSLGQKRNIVQALSFRFNSIKHFVFLHLSHLLELFFDIRFIYVLCNIYHTCLVYTLYV